MNLRNLNTYYNNVYDALDTKIVHIFTFLFAYKKYRFT